MEEKVSLIITDTQPAVTVVTTETADEFFQSVCPQVDICTMHSRGCDATGTKHNQCAKWNDCLQERYGVLCVTCGWVRLHNGDWVEPIDGPAKLTPDAKGVHSWRYANGIPVGNIGGVICPSCSPPKP
jgi:hypothetical protein